MTSSDLLVPDYIIGANGFPQICNKQQTETAESIKMKKDQLNHSIQINSIVAKYNRLTAKRLLPNRPRLYEQISTNNESERLNHRMEIRSQDCKRTHQTGQTLSTSSFDSQNTVRVSQLFIRT